MRILISNENELFKKFNSFIAEIQSKEDSKLFYSKITNNEIKEIFYKHIPKVIFKTKYEWDCSICRHAIYMAGKILVLTPHFELKSILGLFLEKYLLQNEIGFFENMFEEIGNLAVQKGIEKPFTTKEKLIGLEKNLKTYDDGQEFIFSHFYFSFKDDFVNKDISRLIQNKHQIEALLKNYNHETLVNILDFINEGYLYRGEEKRRIVESALEILKNYRNRDTELVSWYLCDKFLPFNSDVISTLADDLQNGIDTEQAIKNYNTKVAPSNYRQPKIEVLTKQQALEFEKAIKKLGFSNIANAFSFVDSKDISIANVLWTDRKIKLKEGIVGLLSDNIIENKTYSQKIDFNEFLELLKSTKDIEIGITPELGKITLIKCDYDNFYKWNNCFGYCYETGLADYDVITKSVKKHGGKIDAKVRISLYWENLDDLDLHLYKEGNTKAHIYYGCKHTRTTTFELDIDMNVNDPIRGAIENIFTEELLPEDIGMYKVSIHNYTKREKPNKVLVGLYINNKIVSEYELQNPSNNKSVEIFQFEINENLEVVNIKHSIPPKKISDNLQYKKVNLITLSPNYWNEDNNSNKHLFFFIPDEKIDTSKLRPFNNEQVIPELSKHHRRALNVLSKKIIIKDNPALVGYGLSFAKERKFYVKLDGRNYEVIINPAKLSIKKENTINLAMNY